MEAKNYGQQIKRFKKNRKEILESLCFYKDDFLRNLDF